MLRRLLGSNVPQVAAMPVRWSLYMNRYPAGRRPPLLAELTARADEPDTAPRREGRSLRSAIDATAPEQRAAVVTTYVSQHVGRVLGLREHEIDPEQPLSRLGLDSLMAVELKHRLKRDTSVDVPLTRLLDGLSVADLGRLLLERMPETTPAAVTGPESGGALVDMRI